MIVSIYLLIGGLFTILSENILLADGYRPYEDFHRILFSVVLWLPLLFLVTLTYLISLLLE